jgi:4-amino-4-deoxy-L-arabinose transferase-like glycosyltransferase
MSGGTGLLRPSSFAAWLGIGRWQLALLLAAPLLAVSARLAAGDGWRALHPELSALAWIAALAAVLAGAWSTAQRPGSASPVRPAPDRSVPALSPLDLGIAGALFAGALAVRAIRLGSLPDTLSGDEAGAALFALRFLDGEADNLFTVGWFSFPSLYSAIQAVGLAALGRTVEGVRVTSALAGALTVPLLFGLGRALFGRLAGLLAAVLLLAMDDHVAFSRIGLQNVWDGLFAVLALAALWIGWSEGRRSAFLLCGLALGLGQSFYVGFRVIPLLVLGWCLLGLLLDRARRSERLAGLACAAWVAVVAFLPLGLFFRAHPNELMAPFRRVSVFREWLAAEALHTGQSPVGLVAEQLGRLAAAIVAKPIGGFYEPGGPVLAPPTAVLFVIGLVLLARAGALRALLVLLPILAALLGGALTTPPPASQRIVMVLPLIALISVLPLAGAVDVLSRRAPAARRLLTAGALLAAVVLGAFDLARFFGPVARSWTLGGTNTRVATRMALELRDREPPISHVFFVGQPRMGFATHSTVELLAPSLRGEDLLDPAATIAGITLDGPTAFVVLPEHSSELAAIRAAFPGGMEETVVSRRPDRETLFLLYLVAPTATPPEPAP